MGTYLLRGITTALLVTVLTLFVGIAVGTMGLGVLSASWLLAIGLLASCLVGGYRTAKDSGEWWMGGATGAGYVTVGTLLLALFLPIRGWGFIQILAEGVIIGLVAGAIGAGGVKGVVSGAWQGGRGQSHFKPSYADCGSNDHVSSEFDWDREENLEERGASPKSSWMESSVEEIQETRGTKRDYEEGRDVEWSWDREDDHLNFLGSRNSESLTVWEPELVRADVLRNGVVRNEVVKDEVGGRNGASLKNTYENKEGAARPWWEE